MFPLSLLLVASVVADTPPPSTADDFLGRWNVRITDASDTFTGGWFKIEKKGEALGATLVWRWGSALPATAVEIVDGKLRLTRQEQPGKVDVFRAEITRGQLSGRVKYADGAVHHFEGRRVPKPLPAGQKKWGPSVSLFDGTTLDGWRLRDPKAKMGWAVVNGELAVVEPKGNADLVSDKAFGDLKLHIEFNVEPKSNSGVYLRGRYEIQILDDPPKTTESHGMGALYSRIPASRDATRPAGEWQSFDITLLGSRLTVVLNGQTIIDAAEVEGITGGAINPFEDEPGPLMLQGDHGRVRFRNIVVTPAE